ncbi:MAG: hypothetical protein ACETWQ_20915 [Phycisphaerae bacterium]
MGMKIYNKIPVWENKNRLKLLYKFRELIDTYFNNVEVDYMSVNPHADIIENETARQVRIEINRSLSEVREVLHSAGIHPVIQYTPPPATVVVGS